MVTARGKLRRAGATIHDVARLAGVSLMTVSRVANGSPHVSAATRQRVQAAITQLGFVPSSTARGLRSRRSMWIALVFQRAADDAQGDVSYVVDLQEGVLQRCRESGYHAAVEVLAADQREAAVQLRELAQQLAPDGMLLSPPLSSDAAILEQLRALGTPFVCIAPATAGAEPCVMMDDRAAARQMTAYLLSLGHRRIGFVRGHPLHGASEQRLAGYRDALLEWQVPFAAELAVAGDFSFEGGRGAAAELLSLPAGRPTAIFASNDESAAGCLAEAHYLGLRVPQDLTVTGFDDTYIAGRLYPPLTTIRQPIREMGHVATGQLLALVNRAPGGGAVCIPHRLVERQSAGPPPRS